MVAATWVGAGVVGVGAVAALLIPRARRAAATESATDIEPIEPKQRAVTGRAACVTDEELVVELVGR
jgi:hypothetical protein